jgi:cytochrome P460
MNTRSVSLTVSMFCAGLAAAVCVAAAADSVVAYPEGYRHWEHVKSMLIGPQSPFYEKSGGLHHVYANEKALQGFSTGRFPDGAVFVFDLLEVQESKGATVEGARKLIDVMEKDSKRFEATGGWGFEEFKQGNPAERALTAKGAQDCYTCHTTARSSDFVFSKFRR